MRHEVSYMYMQYNVINYTITLIAMYACKFITHSLYLGSFITTTVPIKQHVTIIISIITAANTNTITTCTVTIINYY